MCIYNFPSKFSMLLSTYTMRNFIKQGILGIAAHNSFRCCYHRYYLRKEKKQTLIRQCLFLTTVKGKFCPFHRCLNFIILQHNLTHVTLFQKVLRLQVLPRETAYYRALSIPCGKLVTLFVLPDNNNE